ncbi:MAG: SigB/SigF/SigG family RNA polymerase sigma factor [Conexibacter sp.]
MSAVPAVHQPVDYRVDEHELLRRWHEQHDEDARRALIERMLPLVRSLARRYANRGEPLDDLEQVGCVGLIKAVDRFDLERELRFSTFAVPTILGEIKRHFRDRAWSVHVSRGLQELSARVAREVERLSTKLGRSPTIEDVAAATGSTPEQVLEALQGAHAYSTVPLEDTLGEDGEPVARLGGEDPAFEVAEQRIELSQAMRSLSERERRIVLLRFFGGLTQREIAERVGISQMHVSRLLRRALERMGETLVAPPV